MKRRYMPSRTRAARSLVRIVSPRAASGRFVPILDEGTYAESNEIEGWADAETAADPLWVPPNTNRRWH